MVSRYHALTVDPNLQNNAHSYQLQMIGTGKRVLELGAAAGDVTRVLTARGCRVTAVEYDEANRADLEEFAERVVIADLNDPATLAAIEGEFDAIMCGDILEHLLDPERVVRQAMKLMTPDGVVVVSLPNIAHIDVRLALLDGQFDYTATGLLDRTHIRFFTRKSIDEFVDAVGLSMTDMRPVRLNPFTTELGIDPGKYPAELVDRILEDPDADIYQYVFSAVRNTRDTQLEQLRMQYEDLVNRHVGLAAVHTPLVAEHQKLAAEHQQVLAERAALLDEIAELKVKLDEITNSKVMRYTAGPRRVMHAIRGAAAGTTEN